MRNFIALLCAVWLPMAAAQSFSVVLHEDFEQSSEQHWQQLGDCQTVFAVPRSGATALRCKPGINVLFSKVALGEMGVLELWVKPETDTTAYRIQVLVSTAIQF